MYGTSGMCSRREIRIETKSFAGAFADRHGRKINILFGVTASAMDFFFRMAILSPSLDLPPYFMLVDGLVAGTLIEFTGVFKLLRNLTHKKAKNRIFLKRRIGRLFSGLECVQIVYGRPLHWQEGIELSTEYRRSHVHVRFLQHRTFFLAYIR